jgi:hypothetical protein
MVPAARGCDSERNPPQEPPIHLFAIEAKRLNAPLRTFIPTVLVAAFAWEAFEHYLEADSWPAVMHWMQGVEFIGNRMITDPLLVLAGALIFRRWGDERLAFAARAFIAIFVFTHVFVLPDCMAIQRLLPEFGTLFGAKETAWFDIWSLDHFVSGISVGAFLVAKRMPASLGLQQPLRNGL